VLAVNESQKEPLMKQALPYSRTPRNGLDVALVGFGNRRRWAARDAHGPTIYAELDKGKAFETIQERDRLLEAVQPSLVVQSSARSNVQVYSLIRGGYVTRSAAARRCVRGESPSAHARYGGL
jgi:hypothetical protein